MLFEANWQLLLKWHSSYGFLPKSEAANTLTPAQGGGCKGHSAIDQGTQQVIEMELIKLNQWSALDLFWMLDGVLTQWLRHAIIWHADAMVLPMITFVCMHKPTTL